MIISQSVVQIIHAFRMCVVCCVKLLLGLSDKYYINVIMLVIFSFAVNKIHGRNFVRRNISWQDCTKVS